MKIKNFKLKIFLLFAICYTLFPISRSYASTVKLGVYPPIMQIEALPPAKVENIFTVYNLSGENIDLKINLKPFTASSQENGDVEFISDEQFLKDDPFIFQKIKIIDPESNQIINSLSLGPKQKKELNLVVDIPKDQTLSDYYFSIVFTSINNLNPDANNQSTSIGGIATNILLSVGPKDIAKGNIEEFTVPSFVESGPVPFTIRIKNKGSHFITPRGEILIKNLFGQAVGRVDLLPVNILAQTIRSIPDLQQSPEATGSANQKLEIRNQNLNHPTAFWNEKLLLGPYTATLTIALSENGPLFRRTIYFFALPVQVITGTIIALLIVFVIIKKVRKRLRS